ncbi:MAG: hypothetical protein R6U20_01945 [Longimonas sp.]|uniref:hypothetical protein n=1 Tax=Longimonas sp. TaxID=2039626 RepID=UPI003975932B
MTTSASSPPSESSQNSTSWSTRRWVVLGIAVLFFGFVLYEMINPFPGQPYLEVPHGDHVHYVPKDRDDDARLNDFPTTRPGPNERILPNGRVIEEEPSE